VIYTRGTAGPPPDPRPVLVIGCGYLGSRVAAAWRAAGRRVFALTRGRTAALAALGAEPVTGDVTDAATLSRLPEASTVLYAVGTDRRSGHSMRDVYVGGLSNVLGVIRPPDRFIYVSSTGVYGQTNGLVVDESSATEPADEAGRVVLEAEQVLRHRMPHATVLRFAGIYGPDRLLRRQALLDGLPIAGDQEKWLNLVHVGDGVRAVLAAGYRGEPGGTYIVADGEPVRRRDFYALLAELLGAPPPRFVPPADPTAREPDRRVSNRKARTELGFSPVFPSYREGLPAAVAGREDARP